MGMLNWMFCVRPEDPPEDNVLQEDLRTPHFCKVIRNTLKRGASTAKQFGGGSPLRARADSKGAVTELDLLPVMWSRGGTSLQEARRAQ